MSKYRPLQDYLTISSADEVPMTFAEIEKVLGAQLPPAAFKHRAWWSNNPTNSVITYAWLRAGFESAQVDMDGRKLVFRRVRAATNPYPRGDGTPPMVAEEAIAYAVHGRHPLFGALKGVARIAAGTDLTQPADPQWGVQS